MLNACVAEWLVGRFVLLVVSGDGFLVFVVVHCRFVAFVGFLQALLVVLGLLFVGLWFGFADRLGCGYLWLLLHLVIVLWFAVY